MRSQVAPAAGLGSQLVVTEKTAFFIAHGRYKSAYDLSDALSMGNWAAKTT
jgi:hypothetical protein